MEKKCLILDMTGGKEIDGYNTLFSGSGDMNCGHGLDIDCENGYGLFRFDLTPAGSGHPDHPIPHQMGNVNLYLKFGTQTNSVLNLIVYAKFQNQLEIDRNRRVVYDLSQGSSFIVMRTTQELWQACLFDPVLAPLMQGVFPRDRLPVINTDPAGLIANTDPHDQPGTPWVAMYFESPRESEFFDSYGFPPETYNMDTYILREVRQTTARTELECLGRLLFVLSRSNLNHMILSARSVHGVYTLILIQSFRATFV